MTRLARDLMTPDPVCCAAHATLEDVARLMAQHDCGEIPVIDTANKPVGVITDRDIVCRVVAAGKNPMGYTAETCMTHPVICVDENDPVDKVLSTMEHHQLRRVLVVDDRGRCAGIIAQADIAREEPGAEVAELVREVSYDAGRLSR